MVIDIKIDNDRCILLEGGGMAGQDTIEELTQADLADLPECVSNGWVHTDEPRRERLPWHENLDWADFHDKAVLQAWAETYAGRA